MQNSNDIRLVRNTQSEAEAARLIEVGEVQFVLSMPGRALNRGELLPLTHYLRIVRGLLFKGSGLGEILPNLWPIVLFLIVVLSIGLKRYRRLWTESLVAGPDHGWGHDVFD